MPLHAILKISGATLAADFQQALWQTTLPANINGIPIVTLTPSGTTNGIQATVNVYFASDLTTPIDTFVNSAGQIATFTLTQTVSQLTGQILALQVIPALGQVRRRQYTLHVRVPTPDETAWDFSGPPTPTYSTSDLPAITDIIQDPDGTGTITGDFTDFYVPNKDGSFKIYQFLGNQSRAV